ncbi:MAG: peptidoglycan-binding protein [Crinalium sp.]
MALIKDITDCSTYSVRGLDDQLIAQMNKIRPNLLVRMDDLNVSLGQAVHPWVQPAVREGLAKAIATRGKRMTINSALRTLAGQMLLYQHCQSKRCGISAAAKPGKSNHNNGSAIDIEDSAGWRLALHASGWRWIGAFDQMHYDFVGGGLTSIHEVSVKAFQQLWSISRPGDKIDDDGDLGQATFSRLAYAPAEGFSGLDLPRILKLTQPVQVGDDIGELQLALRKAGIKVEVADKVFGESTENAVKEFQSVNKLVPDGIVGRGTLKALGL